MKLFLDTADVREVERLGDIVDGFTSNPSMVAAAAGDVTYLEYARRMLEATDGKSTSLEVLADDPETIRTQAHELTDLGDNVVVKVPIMTSDGASLAELIARLTDDGVKVNATCVFTPTQALSVRGAHIISVFAGRASYCGNDPVTLVRDCVRSVEREPSSNILWAGVMEPGRIYDAEAVGAHITTAPAGVIDRWIKGKTLSGSAFSRETVREFFAAAQGLTWTR